MTNPKIRLYNNYHNMKAIDLNALRDRAYRNACVHGFYSEELSNAHLLCLIISELMEAVEADRIGKRANITLFKLWQGNNLSESVETRVSRFKQDFEAFIKDTVEDELADAVIRTLSFAGLRDINCKVNDILVSVAYNLCKQESFTESVFGICRLIHNDVVGKVLIEKILSKIFGIASHYNIDLLWHIRQKMRYNEIREIRHGKRY